MKPKAPVIFTIFLLVLVVVSIVIAIGYPVRARFGPLAVGIPTGILLATQIVLDIRRKIEPEKRDIQVAAYKGLGGRYIKVFAWLSGLLAGTYLLGILISFPLFTLAYVRLNGWRWFLAIFLAVSVFALLYGVFGLVLQVYLYQGMFFE